MAGCGRPRYMTPAEVREVMRRMWSKNSAVLKQLYHLDKNLSRSSKRTRFAPGLGKLGGGGFENAYRMFFVQTIAVPPNSVRPMSKQGDMLFEHPQNTALTQVSLFLTNRAGAGSSACVSLLEYHEQI